VLRSRVVHCLLLAIQFADYQQRPVQRQLQRAQRNCLRQPLDRSEISPHIPQLFPDGLTKHRGGFVYSGSSKESVGEKRVKRVGKQRKEEKTET
jgi:hypothetical protein